MAEYIDLTGQIFGRWTVIALSPRVSCDGKWWVCRCICGIERDISGYKLRNGFSDSCGCSISRRSKPKEMHGLAETTEYRTWRGMISRCHNTNHRHYADYGGRGITVCDEWRNSFVAFYEYIGPKPDPKLTLDRINNDGNYEPGNVRWAAWSEQAYNKRASYNG